VTGFHSPFHSPMRTTEAIDLSEVLDFVGRSGRI
jgi:hypothetical protein